MCIKNVESLTGMICCAFLIFRRTLNDMPSIETGSSLVEYFNCVADFY